MTKVDFKKDRKDLYAPPRNAFSLVKVPAMTFLMVDGQGDPNTAPAYREAVEALYAVSYGVKFASKRMLDRDYVVAPLEGLWSARDWSAFTRRAKDEWHWTMMIRQPDWITDAMIEAALEAAQAKRRTSALSLLRHETFEEGRCVQILHVGSYDDEAPVLARLHDEFLPQHGLSPTGRHHEIYLSDPRKTAPAKLRTILRQPVL
ncbi:hypothetical protein SAMN02745126_02791 [Enhydrobacter aerosaccus]|uniref:GyrI-like small molecule binding domain-containing protein n=1 Tax=Enhydrobacter aerosaccus TaxID=225324 RepID=A0A1T4PFM5_9HYPH|nr:GyrI-like domain-containing protein [Enhydrobacter aerosaccus]SJZ90127.1 hypothetical protein SAMN02745126_02791 [Enhydrobacter aerosaccus]